MKLPPLHSPWFLAALLAMGLGFSQAAHAAPPGQALFERLARRDRPQPVRQSAVREMPPNPVSALVSALRDRDGNERLPAPRFRSRTPQTHARFSRSAATVRTTAYTHSESDHLVYGRSTAIGTTLKATRRYTSAAADWSRFPVGTVFQIEGDSTTYVVDDYGSALVGTGTIDIYKPTRASMNAWGVRHVKIRVLKRGCFETSRDILSDRLGYWHCREMYRSLDRLT